MKQYTKITLTMVVETSRLEQAKEELNESLDVIGMDMDVYDDEIKEEPTEAPEDALDCGEDEDESEGSPA